MTQHIAERPEAPTAPDFSGPPDAGFDAVTPELFRQTFGEPLERTLDLDTWKPPDLAADYARLDREVRQAVELETDLQGRIRRHVFPQLKESKRAPKNAGVHGPISREVLEKVHRGLLFNGGVEACDGNIHVHDTLPLTVYQIGVSLVSYQGDRGTWSQRLFRRDLEHRYADPVEDTINALLERDRRGALNRPTPDDGLGEMAQRVLMTYAERALLLKKSTATWRMGHGNPVPYELLTGGGLPELMVAGTRLLRELVEVKQKFVFVASEPRERMLLTIGQALRPLEYAIVGTLDEQLGRWLHQRRFAVRAAGPLAWDDGDRISAADWIPRFIERVASRVVYGLFRATRLAPAQLFYAHVDHADLAAHIAVADSVLQEHRGFPLLISLADHVCNAVHGGRALRAALDAAYTRADAPFRYQTERTTRDR